MGTACSSTRMTVTGSFDMPDVPPEVAEETFCDLRAAPSFVPNLASVEFLRGRPAEVGASWLERRVCAGLGELVLRKTITKLARDPFSVSEVMETVQAPCCIPDFLCTFTITITESPPPNIKAGGCTVVWSDAVITTGLYSRLLSACCVPCLKKLYAAQIEEEMENYYKEALRRTIRAAQNTAAAKDADVVAVASTTITEC